MDEIERRTKARLRTGDALDRVEAGVVDELARELIEGHGLGLVLRPYEGARDDDWASPEKSAPISSRAWTGAVRKSRK